VAEVVAVAARVDKEEAPMRRYSHGTRSLWWFGALLVGVLGVVGVATALEVGEKAPDFTLPGTTGEKISLSQFQGKQHVLLEFFVGDFAPT
jgi:hypothetical protein